MRMALTLFCILWLVAAKVQAAGEAAQPQEPIIGSPATAVTVLDLDALLEGLTGPQKYKLFTSRDAVKRVAQQLYINETLAREARGMGLDREPLQQAILAQKADTYLAALRMQALDAEPVPDMTEAARERYLADPETYSTPTQVRAAHILIRFRNRTGETRPKEEAEALITQLRERALAGEDFEALAMEYSEDPSAKSNKGDLGFFGRGRMSEPFEEKAFALREPGEISEVIETGFGFHVLKLIERQDGELKPFDEVKDGIIASMETEFRRQRRIEYVDRIKADSGLVLYEDIFDAYVNEKRTEMGIGTEGTAPAESK
ncbi:MAG: peptidylprolyl isomerase [Sedimenticolaceae bacterium]